MVVLVRPPIPVRPVRPPGRWPNPVAPIDPTNHWTPPPDWWWRPVEVTSPTTGKTTKYKWPWSDWAEKNSRPPTKTLQPHLQDWSYDGKGKVFNCKLRIMQLERVPTKFRCSDNAEYEAAISRSTYNDMSFLRVRKISFTGGSVMTIFKCGNHPIEQGPQTLMYRISYTLENGDPGVLENMGGGTTQYGQPWYGTAHSSFRVSVLEVDGQTWTGSQTKPIPLPPDYFPPPWEPPLVEPTPEERPMAPPVWIPPRPAAPPIAPPDAPQDPGEEAPPRPVPPGQPGRPGTGTGTDTGPGQKPGPGDGGGGGNAPGSPDSPPTEKPTDKPTPSPPTWPFPPPVTTPKPDPKPDEIPDWLEDFLGEPIGHPSERPPLTAQGTATMLGKLEQKLRVIGNKLGQGPGGGGGGGIDWGDLLQLLSQLLTAPYPAGEYVLGNACKPEQAPVRVPWPAGVGEFSELRARVDALATLIDEHKKMGQPVCVKERQGEPVTVILREKR